MQEILTYEFWILITAGNFKLYQLPAESIDASTDGKSESFYLIVPINMPHMIGSFYLVQPSL